ncbi:hypothetical protein, partial [Streptococcus pneumoniae]|uniref:hypothetical protein n=1 Tax=Streptococcus pneumoniae TaxID=1313 RepID=UPI001E38CB3A
NRYHAFVGIMDPSSQTTAAGTGAWFQYDDSASAQWQTVTYNGTTRETQTTAVTVSLATEYTLEVRHTSASAWSFYINGALVTTHTAVTFTTT